MFDWIADPSAWAALATLTALEIVLGIDNIIFISILTGKLPEHQQARGRTIGLGLAMGVRILLLLSLSWVMGLTAPLFEIPFLGALREAGESARHVAADGVDTNPAIITGRDLILLIGGFFLIGKSTHEIHNKLEGEPDHASTSTKAASFASVLVQIAILDIVFSLDSVITAIGMADDITVMVIAVVAAVGVMMLSAGAISSFVHRNPTIKMLALAFLILIGFTLVAEGMNQHVSKGYIYTAMAFSLLVELLNIRAKKANGPPVELREPHVLAGSGPGVPDAAHTTGSGLPL